MNLKNADALFFNKIVFLFFTYINSSGHFALEKH